ncbi:hypothetical protein ES703_19694 [subsurface metagenome]
MKPIPGKTYSLFLIREFLKVFFISVVFILGLSFIVRTLQGIESWKAYSISQILIMRLLEAPGIISRETLLASSMFASVYTMSNLTQNREILALRSCGVSIYKIISPLIILGFVICIFSLLFEDHIVVRSILIKDRYFAKVRGVKPQDLYRDRNNVIVFGENNIIYKIDTYLSKTMEMKGVMLISKNNDGNIVYRIDAERAQWNGKGWIFYNGVLRKFDKNGAIAKRKVFTDLETDIADDPQYLGRDTRKLENMTLKEGYKYTKMMKKMGFNYKGLITKYNRKIAYSVTLFLVIIIGLTLGSMPFRNALVISFSMTLGIVLVFFFIIEIGYTFGSSGNIPPVIGGWLGNIVFLFICVFLLSRQRV